MKVGTRLTLGFSLVLVMPMLIIGVNIINMSKMNDMTASITETNNVQIGLATEMMQSVYARMLYLRNLALMSDEAQMRGELPKLAKEDDDYAKAQAELERMFNTLPETVAEEKALAVKIKGLAAEIAAPMKKAMALGLANKQDESTKVLLEEVRPVQLKWLEAIEALVALETKLNTEAGAEAKASYETARNTSLILGLLAVLAGAAAAALITTGLIRKLGGEPDYAAQVAQRVAEGDLATPVTVRGGDTTSMMAAMSGMQERLAGIVAEVRSGTDTIATASAQVAAGSQDLSSRTEQQASSLEETASSMEELTSTVKQNADNARQANALAATASEVALKGGEVIEQVVSTMSEINNSAKKIVDIIGVIDGIAFQTNILALNAAVEAARAGEQGRGFAVVASEVRTLAQRSANAAKEIKSLIGDSVEKVETGSRLVNDAGTTMSDIVDSVKRVTDIMQEISAASQEQTSGIEQINQAVTQMDQVTQQNAALVEEAAAASESMQDQAAKLAKIVSVFKLEGRQHSALLATPGLAARPRAVQTSAPKRVARQTSVAPKLAVSNRTPAPAGGGEWEEF